MRALRLLLCACGRRAIACSIRAEVLGKEETGSMKAAVKAKCVESVCILYRTI